SLTGKNLGTIKGTSTFKFSGNYNNSQKSTIEVDINKIKDIRKTEDLKSINGNIKIKDFPLDTLNYIFQESGSTLDGTFDLTSKISYSNNNFNTVNNIIFKDLDIEEKNSSVKIIKLESNNDIVINKEDFLFRGDIEGSQFNIKTLDFNGKVERVEIDANKITKKDLDIEDIKIQNPFATLKKSTGKKTINKNEKTPLTIVYHFFKDLFFPNEEKITKNFKEEKIDIPINLDINQFTISNGTFKYLYPKVKINMRDINFKVDNFTSSPNKKIKVEFSNKFDGSGNISGKTDIILTKNWDFRGKNINLDGEIKLKDINLLAFKELAKESFPNEIDSGNLSYEGSIKIDNGVFTGKNKITIKNLKLGKKTKVESYIPIKASLELMKQSNGNIVLDIPLSGNLNDPSFHLKKVFMDELINILKKVGSSPITIMSSIFNLKEGEIKIFDYEYLSEKPKNTSDLDKIAKLLEENHGIKVKFILSTNMNEEKKASKTTSNKNPENILERRKEFMRDYFKSKKLDDLVEIRISAFGSEKPISSIEFILNNQEK
ncbi:MAG: hypothetical protein DSY38_00665, partial [Fusobacteria bacterium]